jgi:hypothetical protein
MNLAQLSDRISAFPGNIVFRVLIQFNLILYVCAKSVWIRLYNILDVAFNESSCLKINNELSKTENRLMDTRLD